MSIPKKTVLQKFIADSGICSRRSAEEMIRRGLVFVNKKKAELGMRVDEQDEVMVDGKIVRVQYKKIYVIFNKPKGITCTNRKFHDEKNVFDFVKISERLHIVGRLDKNSRGLLLLTNDGKLTQKLTHPKFQHEKKYIILVKSRKSKVESILERFEKGVDIGEGDGVVRAKNIRYLQDDKFEIILTEGKKRQIRRMFEVLGEKVVDLRRIEIGNLKLGNVGEGEWRYLNDKEIDKLLKY